METSNKQELRKKFLAIRNALTPEYEKESQTIIERKVKWFIEHYKLNKLGIYSSTGSEVATKQIIEYCLNNDVEVYLPKVLNDTDMDFYLVRDYESDLELNSKLNVLEPIVDKCIKLEDASILDALFVPLICFDKNLNRIGSGKGYYDRYCGKTNYDGYKIGLSRITQLSEKEIVSEKNDIRLDFVITDREVFVPYGDDEKEFDYDVTYWKLGEDPE